MVRKTLGICFGATTLQAVLYIDTENAPATITEYRIPHEGDPQMAFRRFLESIEYLSIQNIAVTGRAFRNAVKLTAISEPQALEQALGEEYRDGAVPGLVISAGGETQLIYVIGKNGGVTSVFSGNKCASGTGEFFVQQTGRMGLDIGEAVALAASGTAHKIAGRCSVFCKSDCTHALNKGEPRENIAAGLCSMMADKVLDMVKDHDCSHAAIIGGGSLNTAMVSLLSARFSRLDTPQHGACFEAFGAAMYARNHTTVPLPAQLDDLFTHAHSSFSYHPALATSASLVTFKESHREAPAPGNECIIGLDVGSTTTKAVVLRRQDSAILASVYLRTNGNPVEASRACYRELLQELGGCEINCVGLGVTGSGRQIAALHALSDSIINEIIAHATAAAHYDAQVDTIFEIGGQDAKYTYLTNGIASDYAMNEACSAGTGSFLEESARESLNVSTTEIGPLALISTNPPNFTDQCAAFISSDIKRAAQEGVGKNDILAGLVYSICLNYVNRVKGSRSIGQKIFMQGGVCYNKAVPIAMASLLQTPIIVPPDPGLMGAFGVALEVHKRLTLGMVHPARFDLHELSLRTAERVDSFVCAGGKEKCDRKCEINRIRVNGTLYPFGGACNKYYNARLKKEVDAQEFDLVARRYDLLYTTFGLAQGTPSAAEQPDRPARTVGIMRSFMTHALFPLYAGFFREMGYTVVLSDAIDPEGLSRTEAAFCLPAEQAHGSFVNLLKKNPDYIFVPQVMQMPVENVPTWSRTCVFVQGEPYYLRNTFRKELASSTTVVLSPILRMDKGYLQALETMIDMARTLGVESTTARRAFAHAVKQQVAYEKELKRIGAEALAWLDAHPETFGIVLFGRPYNAFTPDGNMNIPHKVASRGYLIIPHDMLPVSEYPVHFKMFWAMGQKILKAAQFVHDRSNLFGFFITNFSCGPDSFVITQFRHYMKSKPSLTLELDQHTADAGIDTRIEAAFDIIQAYRRIPLTQTPASLHPFTAAQVMYDTPVTVIDSKGSRFALTDKRVEVLVPSMGQYSSTGLAAILRGVGINAKPLPIANAQTLNTGRKTTTGKECLPFIVIAGAFMEYLKSKSDATVVSLLFIPTGGGPCRLGQYWRGFELIIEQHKIENFGVFTISDESGYGGLGATVLLKAWQSIVASDVLGDIRSVLSVCALDPASALAEVDSCWSHMLRYFEGKLSIRFSTLLATMAHRLKNIPLVKDPATVPVVSVVGEIYVRRDEFSRKNLIDFLEQQGFAVRVAPIAEYMSYSHYVIQNGLGEKAHTIQEMLKMKVTAGVQEWWERRIKQTLAQSGLYHFEMMEVSKTIDSAKHLLDPNFRGECILTTGLALREILHDSCGVVSIGPFGCMPSRTAESLLKKEMCVDGKARIPGWQEKAHDYADLASFPFLAIETDGGPFPQIIEANLEAFVLQAKRVHARMQEVTSHKKLYKPIGVYSIAKRLGRKLKAVGARMF